MKKLLLFSLLFIFNCTGVEKRVYLIDKSEFYINTKPGENYVHNHYCEDFDGKDKLFYHYRRSDTVLTCYNLTQNTTKEISMGKIGLLCCSDLKSDRSLVGNFIKKEKMLGIGSAHNYFPNNGSIVYVDFDGNQLFTIKPTDTLLGIYTVNSNSLYKNSIILQFKWSFSPFEEQYSKSPIGFYNIDTKDLTQSSIKYPENYFNKETKDYFQTGTYSLININDEIIVSFWYNDTLFVYKEDELIRKVSAKSRYIDKILQMDYDSVHSFSYAINYFTKTPSYPRIGYDPYREKIYRLARHGLEIKNSDGTINKAEDANLSLLVFDKDFNFEGELLIGKGYSDRYLGFFPEGIAMIKLGEKRNRSKLVIKELRIE